MYLMVDEEGGQVRVRRKIVVNPVNCYHISLFIFVKGEIRNFHTIYFWKKACVVIDSFFSSKINPVIHNTCDMQTFYLSRYT